MVSNVNSKQDRKYRIGARKCFLLLGALLGVGFAMESLRQKDINGVKNGLIWAGVFLLARSSTYLRVSRDAVTVKNLFMVRTTPASIPNASIEAIFEDGLLYLRWPDQERRIKVWAYDDDRFNFTSQCGKRRDSWRLIEHLRSLGVTVIIDDKTSEFLGKE